MKSLPLVSVCVITYGHENFIEESINSILMQVCDFDFEVIISNDCSPDMTNAKIVDIINNHPKANLIKYHNHEKNSGAMSNFFFSLKESKSNYIALCEGDDYWTDNFKLQKQIDFLENNQEYSLCFTSRNVIDNNGKIISKDVFESKDWFTSDILNGIICPMQTVVTRNYSYEFINYYDKHKGSFGADKIYSYFYSLKGKLKSLSEITAVYRNNGLGIWSQLDYYEKHFLHIDESLKFFKIIAKDSTEFNNLKKKLFIKILNEIHFEFYANPIRSTRIYLKIVSKYKPPLKSMIFAILIFFKYYFGVLKSKISIF